MDTTQGKTSTTTLTLMLIVATIAPILLGPAGLVATLLLPLLVVIVAWQRPDLGRRWYFLSALPLLLWGVFIIGDALGLGAPRMRVVLDR